MEIRIRTDRRAALLLAVMLISGCSLTGSGRAGITDVSSAAGSGPVPAAVRQAIERVYPALVRIDSVLPNYQGGRAQKQEVSGSGVIISRRGHIVTNYHVAGRALSLQCTMPTGEKINASVVGLDPLTDIAVLALDGIAAGRDLPVAIFGDSDAVAVGDQVLAMGNPLSLSQSVTLGIVSNTRMTIPEYFWPFKFTIAGEEVGSLVKWIGHDALISQGSSGGPLVNLKGEIIGINEINLGLSGAIPGNLANAVAREIISSGTVTRSHIGADIQPLLHNSLVSRGALVSDVIEGGPADKAGIKPGDIITEFNGQAVDVRYPEQIPAFNRLIFQAPVGSSARVRFERDGRTEETALTTEAREPAEVEERVFLEWGMTAGDLNAEIMRDKHRADRSGVLVRSMRPGRGAGDAKPPLREGDIILKVDGHELIGGEDLRSLTADLLARNNGSATVLATLDRSGDNLVSVVKIRNTDEEVSNQEARKASLAVNHQVLNRELAEALGIGSAGGVRLTRVTADSSADKAGLKVGDLIMAVEGEKIPAVRTEDSEVFPVMLRRYKVGQEVSLSVIRDKVPMEIKVALEPSPKLSREVRSLKEEFLEYSVRELTLHDRLSQRWKPETSGVIVSDVVAGGWAALAHLAVGDLITALDGRPIASIDDLEKRMREIKSAQPESIVFFVRRGVHTLFIEVEPEWK